MSSNIKKMGFYGLIWIIHPPKNLLRLQKIAIFCNLIQYTVESDLNEILHSFYIPMRPQASYFHTLLIIKKGGGKGCAHDTCKVVMGSKMWENGKKSNVFRLSIWVLPPFRPPLCNDNNSIKYVKSVLLTWKIHMKIHSQVSEISHEPVSFTEIRITDQNWIYIRLREIAISCNLNQRTVESDLNEIWHSFYILMGPQASYFHTLLIAKKGGGKGCAHDTCKVAERWEHPYPQSECTRFFTIFSHFRAHDHLTRIVCTPLFAPLFCNE